MSGETIHERYMRLALEEAKEANRLGEIPVGAVVVRAVTYWVVGTICAKPDTVLCPCGSAGAGRSLRFGR